jgi:cytochrome b6-f complex iron-sulfur subunit
MDTIPFEREDSERAVTTPQQEEALDRGRNDVAASAQQRLARRRFLRRSILVVGGLSATVGVAGALHMLYPNLNGQWGGLLNVGSRADFPAALPEKFKLNQAGVFYQITAKTFIIHLDKRTAFLAAGNALAQILIDELFTSDQDGSYWLALYQRCTHLGTPVAFRNECVSFKCPSHGAHYHCDGEYLDGPAPRSMDRFPLSIQNEHILIDTSQIAQGPGHRDFQQLLPPHLTSCHF